MKICTVAAVLITCSVAATGEPVRPYAIVGTAQVKCYDNWGEIAPPNPGQPFCGQDAQHGGNPPTYTSGGNGLTVYDNITGLTWQRSPNLGGGMPQYGDKWTAKEAELLPAKLNAVKFGGFTDWRLPTIKELYSLILFSGVDSGPNADPARMKPFLDTNAFKFAYGSEAAGERTIDSQWATSTRYVANPNQMFGVNFADGRIKGYGISMPGRGEKKFFVICCRGNPQYGKNDFCDNGDGTITDRATGLMWSKADSGKGMHWQDALAWVQARNAEKFLGHADWRLPNAKELQSILDYSRSPATTASAAIHPIFQCTQIRNEIGKEDYPFYWTSTTHASTFGGGAAVYLAFGRAAGWPSGMMERGGAPGGGPRPQDGPPPKKPGFASDRPPANGENRPYADVHGAGAQRSDPKAGDPREYPHGRGPQGDVVRIDNFVRCVRDALP